MKRRRNIASTCNKPLPTLASAVLLQLLHSSRGGLPLLLLLLLPLLQLPLGAIIVLTVASLTFSRLSLSVFFSLFGVFAACCVVWNSSLLLRHTQGGYTACCISPKRCACCFGGRLVYFLLPFDKFLVLSIQSASASRCLVRLPFKFTLLGSRAFARVPQGLRRQPFVFSSRIVRARAWLPF